MKRLRTLVLGDIHFPWPSQRALRRVYEAIRKLRPDVIVQIGDLYDFYSFSKFPTDPGVVKPDQEIARAYRQAKAMWTKIRDIAPQAKLYQVLGNHDERPNKRVSESLPEMRCLTKPSIEALFTFEGVTTVHDSAEELFIGDVVFQHGHRSSLGDHAKHNQASTVVGHSHRGGVVFLRNRKGIYWELNAGWLGNEKAPVFKYGSQNKLRNWTVGYGVIDELGPRFVPL